MADISKINAVALANIAKLDAVTAANIAKVNGLVFSTAPAFVGLLDETYGSGAAAAYSTRRLASATTVLLRVRRDTGTGGAEDDDEADVAYDSNNELSLDSAISNASAGVTATTLGQFINVGTVNGTTYTNPDSLTVTASCLVDTWYDQAGSNDAEQATQGRQPQIHDGTVNTDLITENGKPAVDFNGSNLLLSSTTDTANNTITAHFVTTPHTQGTAPGIDIFGQYHSGNAPYNIWALETYTTNDLSASYSNGNSWSGNNSEHTFTVNDQVLFLAVYDTSNIIHSKNGSAITGTRAGSFNTQASPYFIGSFPASVGGTNSLDGYVQEAVIWPTAQSSTNRSGIEGNINAHFQIGNFPNPTSGLLATYTGAAAAYSVRQLANTAALSMRVREDATDTETNIGFDANGDLDTAAIAAHCGTANGYVVNWFDQAGSQNDATQSTSGNQPQIYDGTAVLTLNGKPAVSQRADNYNGTFTGTGLSGNTLTVIQVVDTSNSAGGSSSDTGRALSAGSVVAAFRSTMFLFQGSALFATASKPSAQTLGMWFFKATDEAYQNGTQVITGNGGTASVGTPTLLGQSGSTRVCVATNELIIYLNDQSTNRTGIETDIDTYYQIPGM